MEVNAPQLLDKSLWETSGHWEWYRDNMFAAQSAGEIGLTLDRNEARGQRQLGDAAAVLFTAGFTDAMPDSLLRPVASLPLAIFFQLSTPFPAVQARAYAAALVLTVIILAVSALAQWSLRHLGRNVIR